MPDIVVLPGALRAFAAQCRGAADDLDGVRSVSLGSQAHGDLPSTRTADVAATAGDAVGAAMDAVALRLRQMADVADGTQDNYEVTESEIVAGFEAMSR